VTSAPASVMASAATRLLVFTALLSGCTREPGPQVRQSGDSAFAATQSRGQVVMGVDQYTSAHVFEDLPDGGRIILERDDSRDTAGIATIRLHMESIATAFREGDFTKPFQVHAQAVPGTGVMAARRAAISYAVVERPRGGEVRLRSADAPAIAAIHEFLAFQRGAHHAAAHAGMTDPDTEARVLLRLEDDWAIGLTRRDLALFQRLLADGFVYTEDDRTVDRDAVLHDIVAGPDTVATAHNEEMRVHRFGTTAIVTGWLVIEGRGAHGGFHRRYRFTDTWVRRDRGWQIVAAHDYLVPAK